MSPQYTLEGKVQLKSFGLGGMLHMISLYEPNATTVHNKASYNGTPHIRASKKKQSNTHR
jgi:hypothetical protein